MSECALLDTGFLIRLVKENDCLHNTVMGYFRYFMEHSIKLYVSTIAVAEFCVKDDISSLPLKKVMFLPFNVAHAVHAGKLLKIIYEERDKQNITIKPRAVIPNDTKMLAQADMEKNIKYYVSADSKAVKMYNIINKNNPLSFKYIDIRKTTYDKYFGILDFKDE